MIGTRLTYIFFWKLLGEACLAEQIKMEVFGLFWNFLSFFEMIWPLVSVRFLGVWFFFHGILNVVNQLGIFQKWTFVRTIFLMVTNLFVLFCLFVEDSHFCYTVFTLSLVKKVAPIFFLNFLSMQSIHFFTVYSFFV